MLEIAVQLGNTNKLGRLESLAEERLKDPKLSEAERFKLRVQLLQRAVMARESEGEKAMLAEQEKGARALIKEFPKRPESYQMLLEVAGEMEPAKARTIAKEVAVGGPTEEIKDAAQDVLKSLDAVGKPLTIKFTAVD